MNGRVDGVGNNSRQLQSLITRETERPMSNHVSVIFINSNITIVGQENQRGQVLMIRYDPRIQDVSIPQGENQGRSLPHRNIVRDLTILGVWNGGSQAFSLPKSYNDGLRVAVLVQDGPGGPIIGAGRI